MALQEEGWPLGLQPLNVRVGLVRNRDLNGSLSFNTLLTASPMSSTDSSSDLDTQMVGLVPGGVADLSHALQSKNESTGSFFHDKSITLGSLIGISNILELSRRSTRGRIVEPSSVRNKKNYKSKTWFLSLCSRLSTDAVSMNNAPSLGQFLETERRTASNYRGNPIPNVYGPDDFSHDMNLNSLFDGGGRVAPPQSGSWLDTNDERIFNRDLLSHANTDGTPLLLSCLCGNLTN